MIWISERRSLQCSVVGVLCWKLALNNTRKRNTEARAFLDATSRAASSRPPPQTNTFLTYGDGIPHPRLPYSPPYRHTGRDFETSLSQHESRGIYITSVNNVANDIRSAFSLRRQLCYATINFPLDSIHHCLSERRNHHALFRPNAHS